MGNPHPRFESILLLSLSFCYRWWGEFSCIFVSTHTHYRSTQVVAQLISFPILRLWARVVPQIKVFGVSLNPGPFSVKEHVLITIMASVGSGSAYAVSIWFYVRRDYYPLLMVRF